MDDYKRKKEEQLEIEKRQRVARTMLRMLKQNGTPISKASAKELFEDAGWPYDPDAPYLKLPE